MRKSAGVTTAAARARECDESEAPLALPPALPPSHIPVDRPSEARAAASLEWGAVVRFGVMVIGAVFLTVVLEDEGVATFCGDEA